MTDRADAFKAWRIGILNDAQLAQVEKDLQTVVDVFYAMDRAGDLAMRFLREELEQVKRMRQLRKAG